MKIPGHPGILMSETEKKILYHTFYIFLKKIEKNFRNADENDPHMENPEIFQNIYYFLLIHVVGVA